MGYSKIVAIIILFVCGTLTACSNDLSRPEASSRLQEIKAYGFIFKTIPSRAERKYFCGDYQCPGTTIHGNDRDKMISFIQNTEQFLNPLRDDGYITYDKKVIVPDENVDNKSKYSCDPFSYCTFTVTKTSKLDKYIYSDRNGAITVKIAKYVFDKITGITKVDDNTRIVEFTVKLEYYPLSQFFETDGNEIISEGRKAVFVRYDDGWRLTEVDVQ